MFRVKSEHAERLTKDGFRANSDFLCDFTKKSGPPPKMVAAHKKESVENSYFSQ